ncbi:MAG: polysaccharide biosynthesis/export family protein [Rikenellaceae bacterium]
MRKLFFLILILVAMCTSCATQRKIIYLQDNKVNTYIETIAGGDIRLKPDDVISIVVTSKNPELAAIFNLSKPQQEGSSMSSSTQVNYTVNSDGMIDFPVLGFIEAEGLTKTELIEIIKSKIIDSEMILDPIVTIEFSNLSFSTLGEVASPGNYNITKNKTTILEALSMSGDLTINGVRDRVFLTRKDGNKVRTYQLDLRSKDIYQSPAYYVQQNDVIYVEPNKIRTNQSTVNGNTVRSASFWMSLASFLTTITLLIIN